MTVSIHETALVDPSAKIGEGSVIGAHSVIGPNTEIGAGCHVDPGAQIQWTILGDNCRVGANSIVGGDPQIYNWKQTPSWVNIGSGSVINELTVISRSMYENGSTSIGEQCYIMAQSHVGHDCKLGAGVTVTTLAGLSGHVTVGDHAVIGGAVGIHQFVRIGTMAMVGGMTRLSQDVPPYFTVVGSPAKSHGLNNYALKKHNVSSESIKALKKAYRILVRSGLPVPAAVEQIEKDLALEGAVANLVEFV